MQYIADAHSSMRGTFVCCFSSWHSIGHRGAHQSAEAKKRRESVRHLYGENLVSRRVIQTIECACI